MTKYIDKEKVVSIIKEKRDAAISRQKNLKNIRDSSVLNEMIAFNLDKILEVIDNLEVREMIDCDDATLNFEEFGIDSTTRYAKIVVEAINGAIYSNPIKEKSYESENKRYK